MAAHDVEYFRALRDMRGRRPLYGVDIPAPVDWIRRQTVSSKIKCNNG